MAISTRPTADVHELEALWDLPARQPRRDVELARRLSSRISVALVWTWPALLIAFAKLEPKPQPHVQVPVWAAIVGNLLVLALLAGIIAHFAAGAPQALGFFAATGVMGMVLGIACRTSGHHTGSWWAIETAAFTALTLAALGGLLLAPRARA